MIGHIVAHGRASGVPIRLRVVNVLTLRDGRIVRDRRGGAEPDRLDLADHRPRDGDDHPADRHLDERRGEGHVEEALPDLAHREQLDRDREVGDGKGRSKVVDQEGQRGSCR